MEVISTYRRGPQTVYTVREGERVWMLDRADLPDDVFKRWRNKQASECMRRKRAKEKEDRQQGEDSNEVNQDPVTHIECQSSSAAESSGKVGPIHRGTESPQKQVDGAAHKALSKITCKICHQEEVKKILLPCGHLVVCAACLTRLMAVKAECPLCRAKIVDHFGAFLVE